MISFIRRFSNGSSNSIKRNFLKNSLYRKNSTTNNSWKNSGTILAVGLTSSGFVYKLMLSDQSITSCEPASPIPQNVQITTDAKRGNLLHKLKKDIARLLKFLKKSLAYLQRLTIYFLYGVPLTGLVPITILFGGLYPPVEELTWNYLVWAITQLGPCFIKMAQWASTRPDIFPQKLISKLVRLQDDVQVHHSFATVEKTLQEAFGTDWRNKIDIDPNPLGTGSVAQVFKGTLKSTTAKSNQSVAIKMIHPHVEKLVHTDMELLNIIAAMMDTIPSLEILSIGETMRQFADCMTKQLDLRFEASNLVKFTKKFAEDKWAQFPSPIEGFVTKNVLVETLMEGAPISSFMQLKGEIGDSIYQLKMKLSDLGCRLVLKMVFFDNLIHGDLHPGNILVQILPNGEPRLVILDCGIIYQSKTDLEHKKLVDICFSFMKHDGRAAALMMIENVNEKTPGMVKHAEQFCEGVQMLVTSSEEHSYFEHIGEYVSKICELARVHVVRLDPGYFKIAMALKVVEGISLSLNRDLDMVSKCVPIILKARTLQALGVIKFPSPEEDAHLQEVLQKSVSEDQE